MSEQRQSMVQLADERRLLAEERSHLTVTQRMLSEKESEESLRQSQGSAKYEGVFAHLPAAWYSKSLYYMFITYLIQRR